MINPPGHRERMKRWQLLHQARITVLHQKAYDQWNGELKTDAQYRDMVEKIFRELLNGNH